MVKEDFDKSVMELTEGHGADVVFESSGVVSCVDQALRVMADFGRLVLYSFYSETMKNFNVAKLSSHSISLIGVRTKLGYIPNILKWMSDGNLDLSLLISHRIPFAEGADILKDFGKIGNSKIKVLLDMGVE